MDSQLKDLSSKPQSPSGESNLEDSSNKDDRPLLSSTTTISTSRITGGDEKSASSAPPLNIDELEKKYAPFVRRDVYGTMGRGELPLAEKVLLGIALVTLVPLRVVLATSIVVLYYLICRVCTLFMVPNREDEQEDYAHMGGWRRMTIFWSGRFLSRIMLFAFGFYWIQETYRNPNIDGSFNNEVDCNDQSEEQERPGVIISNHVSHIDILYHMSSSFPSFVAKRSVGKLPLVGLISKCLGCVYVQRESKSSDTKGVSAVVNERIQEAHQDKSAPMMMLFPEGTTTNGNYILPFKTGAFLAKSPVLPVILRYPYERFSPAWDSISGVRHVFLMLCQFVNNLSVTRLPVYYPSQDEKDNPKLYADNVRRLMAREGNLIMSDIGLAEKRVYHVALNGRPPVLHQKDD